ncbi:MAG: hypothetical protein DMD84_18815 [Candidatus Rokuibacteriota bacterium]|nr:MAG: hypothetical protein DMD84_18815 [Candidatus Rokubacteria bacterium]
MPKITWPASWKTRSIMCRKFRIAPDGIATPLARTSSVRRPRATRPARRPTTSGLTAAADARRAAGDRRPWTLLYAVLTPARQRDTRGRVGDAQPGYPACATVGHPPCTFGARVAKQILVVDDEPYLRDIQVLVLRAAGYVATALETASEALDRLADIRPDLILLDMSMPGMDGREFLTRLRARAPWRHLPVILSSGFPEDDIAPLGATDTEVLSKPFSDIALLTRVRRLIGEA